VLLVQRLHLLQVACIVLEDDQPLGGQLALQRGALHDGAELLQQAQRVLRGADVGEGVVDEALQQRG
jgi:hypothetical protein